MFRPPKPKEEEKKLEETTKKKETEHRSDEKPQQVAIRGGGGVSVTRGLLTAADIVTAIKGGTWDIDNLLNPHPVTVGNFPSEYPLPNAQISSLQNIRLLTYTDQVRIWGQYYFLVQDPVRFDLYVQLRHLGTAIDPRAIRALTASDIITVNNLLNPHPVTQLTRTNLLTKPEREDLTSLGGVASPNNAGVQIIAGNNGQKIKVYDAGYHGAVDGTHYFYFGTTTTATTKRFCTANKLGLVHKTFVQPRIGAIGDGLYLFSSVAETNMPYDVGYVQE